MTDPSPACYALLFDLERMLVEKIESCEAGEGQGVVSNKDIKDMIVDPWKVFDYSIETSKRSLRFDDFVEDFVDV